MAPDQPFAERPLQATSSLFLPRFPQGRRLRRPIGISDAKCKLLCTQALVPMKQSKPDCKAHDVGCSLGCKVARSPRSGSRSRGPSPRKVPAQQLYLSPVCREQGRRAGRTRMKVQQARRAAPGPLTGKKMRAEK